MNIETENYERSHGRKPRGRGFWLFEVTMSRSPWQAQVSASGTYTEARREIMKKIGGEIRDVIQIGVCP